MNVVPPGLLWACWITVGCVLCSLGGSDSGGEQAVFVNAKFLR